MSNPKSKIEDPKSEKLCQMLFENASDALLVLHQDQIINSNASAARLFGCSQAELLGRTLFDLSPANQPNGIISVQALQEKLKTVSANQLKQHRFEWLHQRKDGSTFWAEIALSQVLFDEKTHAHVSIRDITRFKQTEARLQQAVADHQQTEMALRESEARYKTIFDNVPVAIYTKNKEGVYTSLSRNTLQYWSQNPLGHTDMELLEPEIGQTLRANDLRVMETGQIQEIEEKVRTPQGPRVVLSRKLPTYDPEGNVNGILGISVDITDRKYLEQQIQDLLERRGRQLQLSRLLAQRTASVIDLTSFYAWVVTQIKEQFRFYHVQLFRYNPAAKILTLAAGYGDIGQKMLTEKYQVPVGQGLIGLAVTTETSILRPNVAADADWQAHPLLPETKGELAIPIMIHSENTDTPHRILGVLDIQTNMPDLLDEEDQLTLEGVASQIASATENIWLHQEMEERVRELSTLQGMMTREGWRTFQAAKHERASGYLFDQMTVQPVTHDGLESGALSPELQMQPIPENGHTAIKPMNLRGEIIGQIGVYGDSNQSLTPEDQEFLEAVAEEVAEALEHARLLEQAQKRAVELEAVAQVSTIASTTLEIEKLLQTVVDLTKRNFGLYHVHLYRLNEAGDTLLLEAGADEVGRQMIHEGWQIPLNQEHSLVARAARTQEGIITNDVRSEPDFLPNPLLPDTRSEMAIPMIMGNKLLGVLDVQADIINRFTRDDLQIMTTLATQVAVALQNASLYQQTQIALAETEQLYDISGALSNSASLDDALQTVVTHALATGVDNASLLAINLDEEGQPEWVEIIATWQRQGEAAVPTGTRFYLPEFPWARLWISNPDEPILVTDILVEERLDPATRAAYQQANIRSSVSLPLRLGGRWIGFVSLNWTTPQHFTDKDERLYQAIMAQMAVVVNNLLLIQQTQAALTEAELLFRASRRINEASSLQEIVAAVAEAGLVSVINRLLLEIFEYDAAGKIEALLVAANWHSGQGAPPTPLGTRYPLSQHPHLNLLLDPEPLFFDDIQNAEQLDPQLQAMMQQLNTRATAVLPLWVGERQLGILILESEQAHHFTQRETRTYTALTTQLAVALENQRLLEETQQALAEVEAVQRRYTVQAWEAYQARRLVSGYEQVGKEIKRLNSDRLPVDISQAIAHKQEIDTTPPAALAGDAETITTEDQLLANHSSLVVPLTVRNQVIGVFGLQEDETDREWLPEEIALVEAIAEQLAQTAENIRLIDETQQRAAREQRVNEISEKIQAAQSLEEALQIAVEEVGRSLQAEKTTVQLRLSNQ